MQLLGNVVGTLDLPGSQCIAVEPHRLFDVVEKRLILGGQRRLDGLEAIQIGRQCQLRGQAFVSVVQRDNALPQLVFRDLYAARV